ncbi:MAG TPA: type IV pilus secretin family protein, partial [Gammaproteobacteria bacterium]|nr:type IV pilus secretin family protein [Gammaproteobacteria bacterium]
MLSSRRIKLNFKGYKAMKTKLEDLSHLILCIALSLVGSSVYAISLDDVSFASLPGDRAQIKLVLSEALSADPLNFTIDNPARIAIDFPGTTLNLAEKTQTIGIGMANSLSAVEAAGRTRVVINLTRTVSYTMEVMGNTVVLNLESGVASSNPTGSSSSYVSSVGSIDGIDFRRGENGEGRIIVDLSNSSIPIDMGVEAGKVIVDFLDAQLPSNLDRKLDVIDFATPVKEIDTVSSGNNVKMTISAVSEDYEHLAYQSDNQYIIEFKPITKAEKEEQNKDKFGYTGERLSLNFQNIEVRAILQLIADFTGLNMVTSDAVSGNVTLRLKNVPWDQALDIILRSRGLGMRQSGNVIMVAPSEELAARERLELEANRQVEELAPLRTEFMQINYADAANLMGLIQAEENNLLSERGTVSTDERTNTLIIQDISSSLEAIRGLISELDVAIRQVLIESRIVNADESFAKDIGVKFGYSKDSKQKNNRTRNEIGENPANPRVVLGGTNAGGTDFGAGTGFFSSGTVEGLITDLPAPAGSTAIALAIGKIGSYMLQLELSALIAEGRGEDIASPRVITSNQHEAVIESGVQIPY